MSARVDPEQFASEAAEILVESWAQEVVAVHGSTSEGPRDHVYASQIRDCTREMALDLLHPEDRAITDPEICSRFAKGKAREDDITNILRRAGRSARVPFELIENQVRLQIDLNGQRVITGKLDTAIRFSNGASFVAEIKSGQMAERATDLDSLNRSPYTRHWLDQLLLYLYAKGEPVGFIVLDRPGTPRPLPVFLLEHIDRVEDSLTRALWAVGVRFGHREMPPFCAEVATCKRCPHLGKSCAPPLDFGEGVQFLTDPTLIALAEQREKNRESRDLYEDADKQIKQSLRGVEHGILGDFEVTGKWGAQTRYELPEDLKAKYKTVDPRGRFTLTLERIK